MVVHRRRHLARLSEVQGGDQAVHPWEYVPVGAGRRGWVSEGLLGFKNRFNFILFPCQIFAMVERQSVSSLFDLSE